MLSGCYRAHEIGDHVDGAVARDTGSDAQAVDAATPTHDVGVDAEVPPECVMSPGCAGASTTIVLTSADPAVDGPGCVDIDVLGSDAMDCDGTIAPIRIVRCAGTQTIYYASVITVGRDSPGCGVVEYDGEASCRCDETVGFETCGPAGHTSLGSNRLRERRVREIGLLGRGVGYRLRACAIE
jgi:hypothetical protein